ncbi:aryldialkylphosphatase [Nakamurella sp. A5-74]|uniref:Aryldialkylphosphatase n=1 Tax=Nakamurella sp. A5-74 TaxID=3158264 RepID=A0AAU8DLQ0_9ACTN
MTPVIRTVLGDVDPASLGPTDYHEHLFQRTPLLPGDDLDDARASGAEAALLHAAGAAAIVDATPIGLGRRPAETAAISQATGLTVVHVTGVHRGAHYPADFPLLSAPVDELVERFASDLLHGMDSTQVRAGVVKVGVSLWEFTDFERRALQAAGSLGARWGVPLMVHLESGSAAHEVLDVLAAAGCPPERVALAHADRNPDPHLHGELASRGAYLGYDGAARHQRWPDSVLIDCLRAVVDAGHVDRLLLGGDVARRRRYVSYGGMPGLAYLFDRFLPRVRAAVGDLATDRILIDNPSHWLRWEPPMTNGS